MPKKAPPIHRRHKKKSTGMPAGRRITCMRCGKGDQLAFGNRTQAEQAAKEQSLDPRDDQLFCTAQHGKVHLTV
jgi:hypothetical protein